jgi:hypothetical protein
MLIYNNPSPPVSRSVIPPKAVPRVVADSSSSLSATKSVNSP